MTRLAEFVDKKRESAKRIIVDLETGGTQPRWRMRLRVRVVAKWNVDELSFKTSFKGRRVVIKARNRDQKLKDAEWLVFLASRFRTVEQACAFGLELQTSLSITAATHGLQIDVGPENKATFSIHEDVISAMERAGGAFVIFDAHGVDVYPHARIAMINSEGGAISVYTTPQTFLSAADDVGRKIHRLDESARLAALLLNAASMAKHPVANLALSIAAVELISSTEKWSVEQRNWIKAVRSALQNDDSLAPEPKEELLQAVNGMFNFGSLEKTRRLIRNVGRDDLLERWEKLYGGRSKLFHGARYLTNAEILDMSGQATALCREIVAAFIERSLAPPRPRSGEHHSETDQTSTPFFSKAGRRSSRGKRGEAKKT